MTEDGICIDVRLVQLQKANLSIDVRFDAIITVFKLVHASNAFSEIEVTPDGIVMDVNDSHL